MAASQGPQKKSGSTQFSVDLGIKSGSTLPVLVLLPFIAFGLPACFSQANKARQNEAKTQMGQMNRAQQAHFFEQEAFASNIQELRLGRPTETESYQYRIQVQPSDEPVVVHTAMPLPNRQNLRNYVGAVFVVSDRLDEPAQMNSIAILCESDGHGSEATPTFQPVSQRSELQCPVGYHQLYWNLNTKTYK